MPKKKTQTTFLLNASMNEFAVTKYLSWDTISVGPFYSPLANAKDFKFIQTPVHLCLDILKYLEDWSSHWLVGTWGGAASSHSVVCHWAVLWSNFSLLFLTEPHFLHAIEYGNFVYFFFREIAVEHNTLGKVGIVTVSVES